MECNGIVDILGQMKNQFNKPPHSSSKDSKGKETGHLNVEPSVEPETKVKDNEFNADNNILKKINTKHCPTDEMQESSDSNLISKRTRRRANSKSIIQNAIARKEKSFGVYEKPKRRRNKPKVLARHKKVVLEPEAQQTSPSKRQALQKGSLILDKNVEEQESIEVTENIGNIRRSQRTLSSENKSSSATVCKDDDDDDETLRAQLSSRLCRCRENKQLYMENESDSHFCTAVDTISDKLIGCSRLVDTRSVPMFRPSTRVPFGVFCESHKQRLIRHNCCSTCGVFCTQGYFSECQSKHHFHKDCKLSIGENEYCPHCGDSSPSTDIVITMHSSKKPIFLPAQRSHHVTARITFKDTKDDSNTSEREESVTPPIVPMEHVENVKNTTDLRIDECNEYGLVEALENNDTLRAATILGNGTIDLRVSLDDYSKGTFLHLATLKGDTQLAYLLVANHIDIDSLDADQNSALMLAASHHKNDIVKYLIKAGADITLKGIDGMTCLHIAAKSGNLEACKVILNSSFGIANFVNFQDDGGWTPLVWACEHGHCDVARYLVTKEANVNIRDVEHNVALHWAAFKGSSQIIELLLNLKSDINVVNVHGDTPLHVSAREDHYNCVIILISRKADIAIVNKNNETPLDCAPKDGLCCTPLALNVRLQSVICANNSPSRTSLLVNDISRGREQNPIQCYNGVDTEGEPKDYTYIKKNCLSSDNVQINMNVSTMRSCSCEDRCKSSECACAKLSLKCWYDEQGKLSVDFNFHDPPLIFECSDLCSCNAILCGNRLVQKPLAQRFQLFKTPSKGWGIRSLNFIATGNYVCEYVGEILTDIEAAQREDDSYLFDLDNRETNSFCIDAKYYGNFARFINHSCDPNLHPIKVFLDHHDLRFPRIALFSKRDIKPDEELSFDYGDKFWLVKYKSFTCDCRAEVCKYSKETIGMTLEKYHMTISK